MKNILVIGLLSLVLFAVAAGLSAWLQTNTATADTAHTNKEKDKKAADGHEEDAHAADGKDDSHATDPKHEKPASAKPALSPADADRVEYRRLLMEVVAADLNDQMRQYDTLMKKVGVEMKVLFAKQDQIDAKAAEVKQVEDRTAASIAAEEKSRTEMEAEERANIARIASLLDQMEAEAAAQVIQQLADGGKTDTAVKVMAQMKERTAAQVLTAITDPSLLPVLVEKLRTLKSPASAGTRMP